MKTVVYRWRLSAHKKVELEAEARREGMSVCALLDLITADWLARCQCDRSEDEVEQAAIRNRAIAAVGTIRGGDPTRSERASELVREIIFKKHTKESNALARRFGRKS
jgi:hypothetical protein